MSYNSLIAQLVGFAALIFLLRSFSINKRKKILFFMVISQLIFAIHYFLLSAYTGAALSLISSLRAYIFGHKKKLRIEGKVYVPFTFILIILLSGIITWQGYESLLIVIALIIEVVALWSNKERKIRFLLLLTAPFWFLYNYLVNSYPGMITSSIIFTSLFIAILKFDVLPYLKKLKNS